MTESEYISWIEQGQSLSEAALSRMQQDRPQAALDELARARRCFERAGDLHWQTYVDHQRIRLLAPEQALGLSRSIERGYHKCFDPKGEVLALLHSASLAAELGNVNQALGRLWAAEALARAAAPERLGVVCAQLGAEYLHQGQYLRAAEMLDQALHQGAEEDPHQRAWCLEHLGQAFEGLYRPQMAEDFYTKALEDYLAQGEAFGVAQCRAKLLDLEKRLNLDFSFSELGLKARRFLRERKEA